MTQRPRLLGAAFVAAFGLLLASAGQALAEGSPTVLSLQVPASAELGESVEVIATLRAQTGEPLGGARVLFFMPAEFGGVGGYMELGSHVTDAAGTTVFQYEPRQAGTITLMATFPGDARSGASLATANLAVSGERQLYVAQAGIRVPILSVFLLAGALAVVFSLYTAVGLLLWGIARQGSKVATPGRASE